MRDGVRLGTDIYRPARAGQPLTDRRPSVTPSGDRNEFLHDVVQAVETAAKQLDIGLQ
jgi:predicted acyl esterase